MVCTYKKQDYNILTSNYFLCLYFLLFSLDLGLIFVLFITSTSVVEFSASLGSQGCINVNIPEIAALRDRFFLSSLSASFWL